MKIEINDLKKLAAMAESTQPAIFEKLTQVIDIYESYETNKYVTKFFKRELEAIGFEYVEIYMKDNETYKKAISTKEIDIDFDLNSSNPTKLRIGVSCKSRCNAGWYEFDFNKIRK